MLDHINFIEESGGKNVPKQGQLSRDDAGDLTVFKSTHVSREDISRSPALHTEAEQLLGNQQRLQRSPTTNVTKAYGQLSKDTTSFDFGARVDQSKEVAQDAGQCRSEAGKKDAGTIDITEKKNQETELNSDNTRNVTKPKPETQMSMDEVDDEMVVMSIDRSKNSSKYYQYD